MDPYIKILDYFTELSLVNYWKENVDKTKKNIYNNTLNNDDWILVNNTYITETFWGQVVNK